MIMVFGAVAVGGECIKPAGAKGLFGAKASAATYDIYTYDVGVDGTVTIIKCDSSAQGAIKIPSQIDGKPVKSIGKDAFSKCGSLTSINIPDSVTSIGRRAFSGCGSLASITIPDSVTSIGFSAFSGTSYYRNQANWTNKALYIGNTLIKVEPSICGRYVIKNETRVIADSAFELCDNLTHITIPSSVTNIGLRAFWGCSSLASITIPNSVTSIDEAAFCCCNNLTSINIPNSVTSIGDFAFSMCSRLESINVDTLNKNYMSENGVLFNKAKETLIAYPGGKTTTTYAIPNSVTSIGDSAFDECDNLTSINIPNSVTSIGDSAFDWCYNLTNINIPNSVTSIGDFAFIGCYGLTNINIPNSVTSIGRGAFNACASINVDTLNKNYVSENGVLFNKTKETLIAYPGGKTTTTYAIPNSVTSIGDSAFKWCDNLTSINIPNSVTSIGGCAFVYCSRLTSVTIGNSVTSIGDGAFSDCSSLTSVTIGNNVTSIGDGAFSDCSSLTNITIPDSVTSIGEVAFWGCNNLTSINIPSSVKSIGECAFSFCDNLASINVDTLNKNYMSENGILFTKTREALIAYPGGKMTTTYTIPNSVENIDAGAFMDCISLTSVTIPDSVMIIGEYAFSGCSNLKDVAIGNGITTIDDGAFEECSKLSDVYYTGSKDSWDKISIGSSNEALLNATIHFNSISEYDLKIMTYNVYCKNEKVKNASTGKVTDCRYETRARYIVNNIMDNEPDSIGLQEVTPELKLFLENFEDLNGRILGARYAAVGEYRDSGTDKSNEGCFIYYNKDKYQVVKSGTIWLSESAEKYSKHSESNYARIATYALLENKETGEEYVHVNTHLEHDHTSEKKTNSAAVSGAEQIVQLLNSSFPNTPAVITGDFNQLKGSAPYNVFINAGFYDSRDASQTKNTYHNSYGIGSGSTPYAAKTIDHILYNGYFNKKSYTVYDEDYSNEAKYGRLKLGYQYPSDHHPVVVTIGTKAKEAELLPVTMSLGISSSTKTVLNDRWFTQNNKEYNHELARFCANFVLGGYKSDSGKMKSWLSQAGFNTSEMNFETGRDEVNYFIASKDIKVGGTVKKVVFAGFIGSHDDQWFSNFDPLGNERANWKDRNAPYAPTTSDNTVHKGFADAREYVYARLKEYMSRNGINKSNSILLITGHSRGAATANLLAAYLIDENSLVSPDRLFTYTFATPNVAKIGKVGDKYNSIFNIVNPEDFVTKVLLSSWGFSRYGITYTLPSQRNDKQHKEYLTAMRRYFREYRDSHIEFEPYNMGEVATYNIVDYLGENVSDLDDFYGKWLKAYQVPVDNIMKWACFTPYYFFRDIMCPIVMNEFSSNELERFLISFPQLSFFGKLVRYFAKINADASVKEKRPFTDFEMAHCMETYCAYTSSLTSSQLTECLKKPEDRRKGYKGTVNCPVDVEIYDKETGELVGRIVNNVIDETVAAKENSIVMDVDGDSKSFWLPSNGDYKVVLIGNDNGTMDYTVAAIDSDTCETERINFYDVIIKDGAKLTGNIDSKDFVLSEHELETEDGKKLASDEYIPDDQKAQVTVTVNVQGDGSASESAKYTKGDYVSLYAYPGMGYYFAGWYENGGLIRNGDNLTFVAKADRDVTAVFEPIKTKISINTPSTTTVSYGFTLNLHANVTDLPDGARIVWSMDGSGFELIPSADGMTCGVKSVSKGSATITAKVVDKNGNAVKDANGNEITASQQLTSKAGFFQKLVAFFKKLFGSNMIIPYALEWIIK